MGNLEMETFEATCRNCGGPIELLHSAFTGQDVWEHIGYDHSDIAEPVFQVGDKVLAKLGKEWQLAEVIDLSDYGSKLPISYAIKFPGGYVSWRSSDIKPATNYPEQ